MSLMQASNHPPNLDDFTYLLECKEPLYGDQSFYGTVPSDNLLLIWPELDSMPKIIAANIEPFPTLSEDFESPHHALMSPYAMVEPEISDAGETEHGNPIGIDELEAMFTTLEDETLGGRLPNIEHSKKPDLEQRSNASELDTKTYGISGTQRGSTNNHKRGGFADPKHSDPIIATIEPANGTDNKKTSTDTEAAANDFAKLPEWMLPGAVVIDLTRESMASLERRRRRCLPPCKRLVKRLGRKDPIRVYTGDNPRIRIMEVRWQASTGVQEYRWDRRNNSWDSPCGVLKDISHLCRSLLWPSLSYWFC